MASERLALTGSGHVLYALKTPCRDGAAYRGLKRVFGIEIDTCRRCGGNLRIIASIEPPQVIAKILSHLERTVPPPPERSLWARAPPVQSTRL
jgi:hypothetical protein